MSRKAAQQNTPPPSKRKRGRPEGTTRTEKTEVLRNRLREGTLARIDAAALAAGVDRAEIIWRKFS